MTLTERQQTKSLPDHNIDPLNLLNDVYQYLVYLLDVLIGMSSCSVSIQPVAYNCLLFDEPKKKISNEKKTIPLCTSKKKS